MQKEVRKFQLVIVAVLVFLFLLFVPRILIGSSAENKEAVMKLQEQVRPVTGQESRSFLLVKEDVPVAVELVWSDKGDRLDRGITIVEARLKAAGWEEVDEQQFMKKYETKVFLAAVSIILLEKTSKEKEGWTGACEYMSYCYDLLYFDGFGRPIGKRKSLDEGEVVFHLDDFIRTLPPVGQPEENLPRKERKEDKKRKTLA